MSTIEFKIINIDELTDGMFIAQDVIGKDGLDLLSNGLEVKNATNIIKMLQNHGIYRVRVGVNVEKVFDENSYEEKEIYEFKETVDHLLNNLKADFEYIKNTGKINKSEIEDKIKEMLKTCSGRVNVFQLMEKMKYLDDYIYIHCYNVTLISNSIGRWLKLKEEEIEELTFCAMLCDLGKIKIPEEVLSKHGNYQMMNLKC